MTMFSSSQSLAILNGSGSLIRLSFLKSSRSAYECKVEMRGSGFASPVSSSFTLLFNSPAAKRVNVKARIDLGATSEERRRIIRLVSVRVFPVPGPASNLACEPKCCAASFCSSERSLDQFTVRTPIVGDRLLWRSRARMLRFADQGRRFIRGSRH